MTHGEKAENLFKRGYNCAQAVLGAYCDELGLQDKTALMLTAPFGGGMGRMREVCGAVSAIAMVAGLKYGPSDPSDNVAKAQHYALIQSIANEFKARNGSIICRELLGLTGADKPVAEKRTSEYYNKRPCAELCCMVCDIFDEITAANH